jgi:predicted DNA-binding transcriptional regulator AlpA
MISLADIVRDPSVLQDVPDGDLVALLERALIVVEILRVRFVTRGIPIDRRSDDDLIEMTEAASMVGVSKSWVEKHLAELPPRRDLCGLPRWLRSDLKAWIRNRPQYGHVR